MTDLTSTHEETTSLSRFSLASETGQSYLNKTVITAILTWLETCTDAHPLVLEGARGQFCTGLQLDTLIGIESTVPLLDSIQLYATLLQTLERRSGITIAAVDGKALGGGVALVATADLVLATPAASFALPEAVLGIVPALIFPRLSRRIGVPRARLMGAGLPPISAETALSWGLVDEITTDLEAALRRHQRRFAKMAPHAIVTLKGLVNKHFMIPPTYDDEAVNTLHRLLQDEHTQARISRFVDGYMPWEKE